MSDTPKHNRTHKRHKSSVSNIGYYFSPEYPERQVGQRQGQKKEEGRHSPQRSRRQVQSQSTLLRQEPRPQITQEMAFHERVEEGTKIFEGAHYEPHQYSGQEGVSEQSHPLQLESSQFNPGPSYDHTSSSSQYYTYPSLQPPTYGTINRQSSSETSQSYPPPSYPVISPFQSQVPSSSVSSQVPYQSSMDPPNMYTYSFPKISDYGSSSIQAPITPTKQTKPHTKGNMSISSHFNLFTLDESEKKRIKKEREPSSNSVLNDLLVNLLSVEGANINNFLLLVLYKSNSTLPLDDFYNILYNSDQGIDFLNQMRYEDKLDSSVVTSNRNEEIHTIVEILDIFKNPNSLSVYFPDLVDRENKFNNINYHELLRTFLAIKVLFDLLVVLPPDSVENPQNHTIPRLSIYKTYYIVCQKLILMYPSSSNTIKEQQKSILGQSKIGKLIKLVYPSLLIKRLGSRGESKYNYLGVIWNHNIVNDEIRKLCDENELVELSDLFEGNKARFGGSVSSSYSEPSPGTSRKSSQVTMTRESKALYPPPSALPAPTTILESSPPPPPPPKPPPHVPQVVQSFSTAKVSPLHSLSPQDANVEQPEKIPPVLSFIKPSIKYTSNASLFKMGGTSWIENIKSELYERASDIMNNSLMKHVLFSDIHSLGGETLLDNITSQIIQPIVQKGEPQDNCDLIVYLLLILEILPYFLLEDSMGDIQDLKSLRLNLVHVINGLNVKVDKMNGRYIFRNNTTSIFLALIKRVINLNDLIITFAKIVIKKEKRVTMINDIKKFGTDETDFKTIPRIGSPTFNWDLKENILFHDMVYSLLGFNFDIGGERNPQFVSPSLIDEEINILRDFLTTHLFNYLSEPDLDPSVSPSDVGQGHFLSSNEQEKLSSLFNLIESHLLTTKLRARYPISVLNQLITFVFNDILKHIFSSQQYQGQIQGANPAQGENSFGDWWILNSLLQEYISLMGEIFGMLSTIG